VAIAPSSLVEAALNRAGSLSRECGGDCPDADDDPSFVIQDMDLLSSCALERGHTENSTPNGFEVGCRVAFA
jgi:hypothetical protein